MVIIREAKKQPHKDSAQAYYEVDPGNSNDTVRVKDGKDVFEWHRKKSNDNVTEKGFSFYLARHAFKDKYHIVDFDLASDPKNIGILGMVQGSPEVMIVIHAQADYFEKGIIRIVSAYYTDSQKQKQRYNITKKARMKREAIEAAETPEEKYERERLAEHVGRIVGEHRRRAGFSAEYGNEKGWDRGW